jgi:hypothetical protein
MPPEPTPAARRALDVALHERAAHDTTRSMPSPSTRVILLLISVPSRNTVTSTVGFCAAPDLAERVRELTVDTEQDVARPRTPPPATRRRSS